MALDRGFDRRWVLGLAVGVGVGVVLSGLVVGVYAGLVLSGPSRVICLLIFLSLLATARGGASFLI